MDEPAVVGAAAPQPNANQYSTGRILRIWAAATLPVVMLGWIIAPILCGLDSDAAPIIYWLLMTAGMGWVCFVALRTIQREEGSLRWKTLSPRIWLRSPSVTETAPAHSRRVMARFGTLALCLLVACVGFCILLVMLTMAHSVFIFQYPKLLYVHRIWPSYANILELVSPHYAEHVWLPAIVMGLWFISSLIAEELLFRGVLLPGMQGTFGKRDWLVNGLLYAAYSICQPWMIPVRLLDTLAVAFPVRRFRSLQMGLLVRGLATAGLLAVLWLAFYEPPLKPLPATLDLPYVSRQPEPVDYRRWPMYKAPLTALPRFNSRSPGFSVDVRSRDLSHLDLRDFDKDLEHVNYDSLTIWPPKDRLPPTFDPTLILELGKNPGLGIRQMHDQGITGRGVGIGIVDNCLLTRHQEYAGRIKWYEEIAFWDHRPAQMHGPAVASIAVGKSVGVAPEADLYFIGMGDSLQRLPFNSYYLAQGVRRLLQINERLPMERRIRAISISSGTMPGTLGRDSFVRAVKDAEARGVLVLCCDEVGSFSVRGMAVSPVADRDDFHSYSRSLWGPRKNCLFVPMDSRTTASPTGMGDYVFYGPGGASWTVPYVAGAYALAAQVHPEITPEQFWSLAMKTGRYNSVMSDGREVVVGPILDMAALTQALQRGNSDSMAVASQPQRGRDVYWKRQEK